MHDEYEVIAGFGGQGVLFAGLVIAHAATRVGRNVVWIPSYGPEIRGGTASCTVIVSSEEIGSPIVSRPRAAVVLNEPSLAKWGPRVQPGGILVVNTSLARSLPDRSDIQLVEIPASAVAAALGNDRVANLVALGALLASTNLLPMAVVEKAVADTLGPGKERLVAPNLKALRRGADVVRDRSEPQAEAA